MAIFGTLEEIEKQSFLRKFPEIIAYLKKRTLEKDIQSLEDGKSFEEEIKGRDIFVIHQAYHTKPREEKKYESHRKYIDIQFIVSGEELMEVTSPSRLTITSPYDDKEDYALYSNKEKGSTLDIKKGEAALFFPQDAHMPCLNKGASKRVIKSVVKFSVHLLENGQN